MHVLAQNGFREGKPRAFTLVELLVVIAVIGILASLLMTALASARAKGQGISCLSNLRQVSLACQLYTVDFRDWLPYNLGQAEIQKFIARNWYWNWTSPVMNWELDSDNTNSVLLTRGGIGPYASGTSRIYRCPSDVALSDIQRQAGWSGRVRSISMNAMIGNAGEYTLAGSNVNNPGYRQFFRASDIPQPANIFIFIEEHPDSINDGYFLNSHYSRRWTDLPASYHQGSANLTFADGHVESRKWKNASTQPPPRPDSAGLPFRFPSGEAADFEWLMDRTSIDSQ